MGLESGLHGAGVEFDRHWKTESVENKDAAGRDVRFTTESSLDRARQEISSAQSERRSNLENVLQQIDNEFVIVKGLLAELLNRSDESLLDNIDAGLNNAGTDFNCLKFIDEDNVVWTEKIAQELLTEENSQLQKNLAKQLGQLLQNGQYPKQLANEQ